MYITHALFFLDEIHLTRKVSKKSKRKKKIRERQGYSESIFESGYSSNGKRMQAPPTPIKRVITSTVGTQTPEKLLGCSIGRPDEPEVGGTQKVFKIPCAEMPKETDGIKETSGLVDMLLTNAYKRHKKTKAKHKKKKEKILMGFRTSQPGVDTEPIVSSDEIRPQTAEPSGALPSAAIYQADIVTDNQTNNRKCMQNLLFFNYMFLFFIYIFVSSSP